MTIFGSYRLHAAPLILGKDAHFWLQPTQFLDKPSALPGHIESSELLKQYWHYNLCIFIECS